MSRPPGYEEIVSHKNQEETEGRRVKKEIREKWRKEKKWEKERMRKSEKARCK
jgi:hypothetical protein